MGFPSGYAELLLARLFLHLLSLLGLIRALILAVLSLLGLSDFLEPDFTWPAPPRPTHSARPGPGPVSASALIREMLPVVKFSEVAAFSGADETPERCAVSLYDSEGKEIRRLRNCRHIFHRACLDRWMDHEQRTCPLCRTSFIPEEMQDAFNERFWADVYGECFAHFRFLSLI